MWRSRCAAEIRLDRAAAFAATNLEPLRALCPPGHYLNLNFPGNREAYRGVGLATPCVRVYHDGLVTWQAPKGDLYCHLTGQPPEAQPGAGTDYDLVSRGMVSITALAVEPGARASCEPSLDELTWEV